MLRCIEVATPDPVSSFHYLSFGYIIGGLVQKVSGRHIREFIAEEIAKPIKMEAELCLGLPADQHERAASICNGFGPDGEPPSMEMIEALMESKSPEQEGKNADFDNQAQFSGGLSLLDPCVFNTASVRKSCIPSANTHCSARALAKFYSETQQRKLVSSLALAEMLNVHSTFDGQKWGLGVQVFEFGDEMAARNSGFGHTGMGGTVAYCDLASQLVVAVCVNKLTLDQRATQALLRVIHSELGVPSVRGNLGGMFLFGR